MEANSLCRGRWGDHLPTGVIEKRSTKNHHSYQVNRVPYLVCIDSMDWDSISSSYSVRCMHWHWPYIYRWMAKTKRWTFILASNRRLNGDRRTHQWPVECFPYSRSSVYNLTMCLHRQGERRLVAIRTTFLSSECGVRHRSRELWAMISTHELTTNLVSNIICHEMTRRSALDLTYFRASTESPEQTLKCTPCSCEFELPAWEVAESETKWHWSGRLLFLLFCWDETNSSQQASRSRSPLDQCY